MNKERPPPYSGPPPPGFVPPNQPPPHQPQPQVIIHTVHTSLPYGPNTQTMVCPYCHADILTRVEVQPNTKTHLFALLLCLFQCYPCCFIPYCMDSCQSKNHYCPNCNAFLGAFED